MTDTYRVGRKLGRTLYHNETLIGLMDTPELAATVVAALNGQPHDEPTSAHQAAAEAALIASWPYLADDPVYVEQLAAVALNAAYNPAWQSP